ncbi:hypothetical protein XELAEV_18046807mg [Xenopus laevis]|uniref:Uncharacterized protein n=1 Tax=Xenopus laevis TaxID=8355 RepID=A0A974H173_XENLA|nr:hypothetical protein XELAEV_18046807mg [Xenopus laevis]
MVYNDFKFEAGRVINSLFHESGLHAVKPILVCLYKIWGFRATGKGLNGQAAFGAKQLWDPLVRSLGIHRDSLVSVWI